MGTGDVAAFEKHPHGRGEDKHGSSIRVATSETPPRAWGRQVEQLDIGFHGGNTPTGVGKTFYP